MSDNPQTLFGFPVVITDTAPVDTVIFGPMPTYADLLIYGSFENYVEAHKREFAKITGLGAKPDNSP